MDYMNTNAHLEMKLQLANDEITTLRQRNAELGMQKTADVKEMVNRFLSWELPNDFHPDCGISFKADFNEHTQWPMKHEPMGTNLFHAGQAKAMIEYIIGDEITTLRQRVAELALTLAVINDGLEANDALDKALHKIDENTITELQAHITQLREALEACKYDCQTGDVIGIAAIALAATPAQSLSAHDDELIERCAVVCDKDAKDLRQFSEPQGARIAEMLADKIRELKGS